MANVMREEFEQKLGSTAYMLLINLPSHMQESVMEYTLYGYPVGDFLYAVMSNNLTEAFARADALNQVCMKNWAEFVYGAMPVSPIRSVGSKEDVEEWKRFCGLRGLDREMERRRNAIVVAPADLQV